MLGMSSASSEMFNKEQKEEYLSSFSSNKDSIQRIFKKTAITESLYNKDLADMSEKELVEVLGSLNLVRVKTRGITSSIIRNYIKWAILMGKTTNTDTSRYDFSLMQIKTSASLKNKMIKNPLQVKEILSASFSDGFFNQPNKEIRDSLIFWLVYSGLTLEEVQALKKTDIDTLNKVIKLPKGKFVSIIDKSIIPLWKQCKDISFIESVPLNSTAKVSQINSMLVDSEFLFRPIVGKELDRGNQVKISYLRSKIADIFKRYNEKTGSLILVSPRNLRISGTFYQVYQAEKAGAPAEAALSKYFTDYNAVELSEAKTDYNTWKKVVVSGK
jgi:integrase